MGFVQVENWRPSWEGGGGRLNWYTLDYLHIQQKKENSKQVIKSTRTLAISISLTP